VGKIAVYSSSVYGRSSLLQGFMVGALNMFDNRDEGGLVLSVCFHYGMYIRFLNSAVAKQWSVIRRTLAKQVFRSFNWWRTGQFFTGGQYTVPNFKGGPIKSM